MKNQSATVRKTYQASKSESADLIKKFTEEFSLIVGRLISITFESKGRTKYEKEPIRSLGRQQ